MVSVRKKSTFRQKDEWEIRNYKRKKRLRGPNKRQIMFEAQHLESVFGEVRVGSGSQDLGKNIW
jgi:hypothetical protein